MSNMRKMAKDKHKLEEGQRLPWILDLCPPASPVSVLLCGDKIAVLSAAARARPGPPQGAHGAGCLHPQPEGEGRWEGLTLSSALGTRPG